MNLTIDEIKASLSNTLSTERYNHSISVSYTAICLSMRYGYDIKKAEIAGLLHDCAKCISNQDKLDLCNKNNIHITEIEAKNPYLLHTKLGCYIAKTEYNATDDAILNSILYHATGRPNMTLLEKIIYVADYIEPHRYKAKNLDELRTLAFTNLDDCLLKTLEGTIDYLKNKNGVIDTITFEAYNYYLNH